MCNPNERSTGSLERDMEFVPIYDPDAKDSDTLNANGCVRKTWMTEEELKKRFPNDWIIFDEPGGIDDN